jgi:hypothetical protein
MTVEELINKLYKYPPNYEVVGFDPDWDQYHGVELLSAPIYIGKRSSKVHKSPKKGRIPSVVIS